MRERRSPPRHELKILHLRSGYQGVGNNKVEWWNSRFNRRDTGSAMEDSPKD
jgi:hypothetical protein